MPVNTSLKHRIRRRIAGVRRELWMTWMIITGVPHPWLTIWRLIWPIFWKNRLPTLLDPQEINQNPAMVHQQYYVDDNYRLLRAWPIFQFRDTPLRSLYRLHDVLCADDANYVMLESDYFWRRANWRMREIPDPKDTNPIRYAILASLVEEMVDAQNRKISLGLRRGVRVGTKEQDIAFRKDPNKPYEEVPPWALAVPPLKQHVSFLKNTTFSAKPSYAFKKRNISANSAQLWNI